MEPLQSGDPARIGPFQLVARLGAGGMGRVYLGRDVHGRQAAIKVIHPGLASDAGFRSRFTREIATAQRVHSPWTAAVLTADPQARPPWLATEFIPGPSLDQVVEAKGPLNESALTILASRLAHALAHLHAADVVHRDLKPSNVLLAADGPRLIDFGVARAVDSTKITHTGVVVGTPGFMSPEQAAGEDTGPPSDVFSLASVLTYAATGSGPFGRTTNPMAMLLRIADDEPDTSGVPAGLRPQVERCLAKAADARPTAAELAAALDPLGRAAAEAAGLQSGGGTLVDPRGQRPLPSTLAAPPFPAPPVRPDRSPVALPLGVLTGLVALAAVLALVLVSGSGGAPAAGAPAQPAAALAPPVAYPEPARPAAAGTQLGRVPVGNGPQDIVVSPDGSRAYTLNYQDVTVIDTASGASTASIGLSSAASVAFSPDGSRAYLPLLSGFLSVVDTATSTQISAVPIPKMPDSATITADGREVYVVHGDQSGATFLSVLDTAGNTVVATVPITPAEPSRRAGHIMFATTAPGSGTIWVGGTTDSVFVVDPATRTIVDTFDIARPESISFGGGRAYVLNSDGITVYDVATRTKLGQIRQDGVLGAMAASPDGRFLYLATGGYGDGAPSVVRVLDSASAFLVHEIAIDARPDQLAVSPDGRTLFATATQDNVVVVADTTPYA